MNATRETRTVVNFNDLEDAHSFVSDTYAIDAAAYICRESGKIYLECDEYDDEFDVPEDIDDDTKYAVIPDRVDLNLGNRLVFHFIEEHLPDHYEKVSTIFRRKGAFGRFKDYLFGLGKLDDWYTFENKFVESALREWANEEGFLVEPVPVSELERILQFKIALNDLKPLIWRRIQVPETYSFWDLHVAIQDAMGWLDYHLHAFRVSAKDGSPVTVIGIPDEEFESPQSRTLPGWEVAVVDYFQDVGTTAKYEYDFGDGWIHGVTLEGVLLAEPDMEYPVCIGGERACPPEDCGGTPGYERLILALKSPGEESKELLDWAGKGFDPDRFEPEQVRFDDPKMRWEVAFRGGMG